MNAQMMNSENDLVNANAPMTEAEAQQIERELETVIPADVEPHIDSVDAPRMTMAEPEAIPNAPRVKRKYTRRHTTDGKPKTGKKVIMARRTVKKADATPRKRRKKLSPAVRKIEHNVLRHVTKEVRHTGVGWNPPSGTLDPAWNDAIKRLETDGIVANRDDMGGYVPQKMMAKFSAINNQVLAYIKYRFNQTGKGVSADRLIRARQQALVRLERGGKVARTDRGFLPVEGLVEA